MREKILLIGGGGHCKVIIEAINSSKLFEIAGIIDRTEMVGELVNHVEVVGTDDDLREIRNHGIKYAFISLGSVGNTKVREKLYLNIKEIGYHIPNIIHSSAIIGQNFTMGEGNFIGAGTIINPDTIIGNNAIINTGAIIEHDCLLEDFVHVAPGCTICGGVKIGENSHIGAGSTIIQYKKIGKNTIIGAGSVVVKDIGDNLTAFGNPCREVKR